MNTFNQIRLAQSQDISDLKNIAARTELFPPEMLDDMIAGYLDKTKPDIWFVYLEQNEPIAFGFCEPERMTEGTWNLLALGVLPAFQGEGIGSEMLAYLEQMLAHQGHRILLVETMGTAEFEQTRQFYVKNGFEKEARIREFYEKGADKIVFWKHL